MVGRRGENDGTRRVHLGPPEQQDRLEEQLGTEPCGRAHPSQAVEHGEERLQGTPTLVRLSTREQTRQTLAGDLGAGSTDEDKEANQDGHREGRTPNVNGTMTIEERQVEDPMRQASDPLAHARPRDPVAAGHGCDLHSRSDFRHGPQDVGDVIGLTRKQVAGQNSLARPTRSTAHQPKAQLPVARGGLHAPLNPAAGQSEIVGTATSADTTLKNRVLSARQDLGVAGRIHSEYVDHCVPSDGSGAS